MYIAVNNLYGVLHEKSYANCMLFCSGATELIEGHVGGRLWQAEGLAMATADPMCHIMSSILRSIPAMSSMNLCWWVVETGPPSLAVADQSRRRSDPPPWFGELELLQMLKWAAARRLLHCLMLL